MSKRRAERQLTDRDDIDSLVGDDAGQFSVASPEVMAGRKIVKAKRKGSANVPQNVAEAPASVPTPSETTPSVESSSAGVESAEKPAEASKSNWPTFSFTSTGTTTGTPAPAAASTAPSWPTFSFTSDKKTETAAEEKKPAAPAWPTFNFKTTSTSETTPEKKDESPAKSSFAFAPPTWPSFNPSDAIEKKEGDATSIFSWPTFTFKPTTDNKTESAEKPTLSWPSLTNPLASATGAEAKSDPLASVHSDLTTLGEGKQEALSLTNANKGGILGVNIAAPKESDEGPVATLAANISPSKLSKVEGQATGEEGEETEFKARAKLHQWNGEGWNERGVGQLKVNYNQEKNSTRIIMRGDTTGRLLLNFPVFATMLNSKQSAKAIRIGGFNHTGETTEVKPEQFSLRFLSEDEATQCFQALTVAISRSAAATDKGPTTTEKPQETTETETK